MRRGTTVPSREKTLEERFWEKVDRRGPDECWLWRGASKTTPSGAKYGVFWNKIRQIGAYCFAYELLVGPILSGLTIDHLCRNPLCVNPRHLEPVTMKTNLLRGMGIGARNARKTHCPMGHPYDEENTHHGKKSVARTCRTCMRIKGRIRCYYQGKSKV
jgi:hypothetical protein